MVTLALIAALVFNPAVTAANVKATVCRADWTASVRPPAAYTTALKRRQLPAGSPLASFEEDHVTPLCLGGHPTDPRNLRPQPWPDAKRKDVEERALCRAVCAGRTTLSAARRTLHRDWP